MEGDFKTLLRKFCLESSVLGLKYFYLYPDPLSRCYWAVSLCLTLLMSGVLTLGLYYRFAEMPTRIAIENQYAPSDNMSYPAITLCSPNQITVGAMQHFEKTLVCYWAVSLCLTLLMSGVLTLGLYYRFAEMPTRIAIENQYAPSDNMSYPAITLCSPNQITVGAMQHFERTLVDGNLTIDLKSIFPKLLGFYELFGDTKAEDLMKLQHLISLNRYTAVQMMGMLSQSCDDFLKVCYLKMIRYPKCIGLFRPIMTKHGMCCIFNSIYHYSHRISYKNERVPDFKPHTTATGGLGQALTVVTDFNPDSALGGTLLLAGATRIMFTHSSEFPADDESSMVHAHSESFHCIHATYTYCSEEVSTLPHWSRQCYFEDEHSLPPFTLYHNSDCDLMCDVRAIEEQCHCTVLYVPHLRTSRACNLTSIDCIVNTKLRMNKWHQSGACDCLRDCVSFRYQVEVSVGNLDARSHLMHDPYAGIKFNASTSILHFFFRNSVHAKQKQETVMSLISLSSNIGGVFGLCLGCSVMSVLEICFFVKCAIANKIRGHLQRLKARKNKVDFIRKKEKNIKRNRSFEHMSFNRKPIV